MTETALIPAKSTALTPGACGPLDRNPAAVYLAGLSSGSQRAMLGALSTMADMVSNGQADAYTLPWQALRYEHTAALKARLGERYAPATANRMVAALRGVLLASWRLGLLDADTYKRAADVGTVRSHRLPKGRALTAGEIAALLDVCANDTSPAGARDGALLATLRAGGLRRAEVCALELADYAPTDGALKVRGKGNKERVAYLDAGAAAAMADWLALRGNDPGPLFCPVTKSGHVLAGQRISPQAVYNVLGRRAAQASVNDVSPHDLRRTFVSDLLDAGADIATVQRLAGHANPTTTSRYDRRGEDTKRKAVAMLHTPWRRPRM